MKIIRTITLNFQLNCEIANANIEEMSSVSSTPGTTMNSVFT